MKKLMIVLVLAAAVSTSCNNAGSEASSASPTRTADSATKVASDTLKAAPVDSVKTDTTKH
jgi:FlaG/FlaF family flagellin (archaellin)